jgi:hypothetical protein
MVLGDTLTRVSPSAFARRVKAPGSRRMFRRPVSGHASVRCREERVAGTGRNRSSDNSLPSPTLVYRICGLAIQLGERRTVFEALQRGATHAVPRAPVKSNSTD